MQKKKHIIHHLPNFLTSMNLLTGSIAIVFALTMEYRLVLYLIILASVFDFLDGMVARMVKAYSEFGKILDSLADLVSFGVVPSVALYSMIHHSLENRAASLQWLPFFAFLVAVFSALRLAKFHLDTRQTNSFVGLPTPANALMLLSFILLINDYALSFPFLTITLTGIICLSCFLMVSEFPMFSLKLKNFSWKENAFQYILIVISLFFILFFKETGIFYSLLSYILLSLIKIFVPY